MSANRPCRSVVEGVDRMGRNPAGRVRALRPKSRRRILCCLFTAAAPIVARANDHFYQGPNNGDWNSAADPYFSWLDVTAGTNRDVPAAGGVNNAFLAQSGTNGVGNQTVFLNYAYTTPGLVVFRIDSGNSVPAKSLRRGLKSNNSICDGPPDWNR